MHHYIFLLSGEWEIGAFDDSLKSRGMSIHYTVRPCAREDLLVDHDSDEDDLSEYIDQIDLGPRGTRPRNQTVLVRVCKKAFINNTQSVNISGQNVTDDKRCHLRKVILSSPGGNESIVAPNEKIPQDILEELETEKEFAASPNGSDPAGERTDRQRRQAEVGRTDVDISSGSPEEEGESGTEILEQTLDIEDNTSTELKSEERNETSSANNRTEVELEESNDILLNRNPVQSRLALTVTAEPISSVGMDQNYIQTEPEELDREHNYTSVSTNMRGLDLSIDYDDYSEEVLVHYFQ